MSPDIFPMDYRNYYFSSESNGAGGSDNSGVLMDSSSMLRRLRGGYGYNDLMAPEAELGRVLKDDDPFRFSDVSLMDFSGSEHRLTPSDSALHVSRELRSVFQFEEPPSLLSSLRSSSSFSRNSATPNSALSSCYKSPGFMGLGDDVLVIDGVLVKDEKGFGTRRQSSLFSAGKKRESSPRSHRLRHFTGSGRRKYSGGGNCRSDGRSWKKENTTQGLKYKTGYLEEEPHWNSQLPEQPVNRDGLPQTRALAAELWRMQMNHLKGCMETALPLDEPWPPELPLFDRKQSSVRKVYETTLRPWALPYSSESNSSRPPPQASPPPPPPPPPPVSRTGFDSSSSTVEQEPNSPASLSEADGHWPTLSSIVARGSARRARRRSNTPQPPPTPPPPPLQSPTQAPIGSSSTTEEQEPNKSEGSQGRSAESSPPAEQPSTDQKTTSFPEDHVESSEPMPTEGSTPPIAATPPPLPQEAPTQAPIGSSSTTEEQEPCNSLASEGKAVETSSPEQPSLDQKLTFGRGSSPKNRVESFQPMPPDRSSSSQPPPEAPTPFPPPSPPQQPPSQTPIGSCGTTKEQEPDKSAAFIDKAGESLPPEHPSIDEKPTFDGSSITRESTQPMPQDKSSDKEPALGASQPPPLQQPTEEPPMGSSGGTTVEKEPHNPTASRGNAAESTSTMEKPTTTPPNKDPPPTQAQVSSPAEGAIKIIEEETRARRMWAHTADELPPPQGKPFSDFPLADEEERLSLGLMYGPRRRRRLPVFEDLCPSSPDTTPGPKGKGSSSGSKKE